MFWNFYFISNILIMIIFFLNFKKYKFYIFIIPFGFLFYLNFYYRDNLDIFRYYSLDIFYLLPSYASSLQNEYSYFFKNPYVNVFSSASYLEIISRNILLYFKINNIKLWVLPFIFLIFYIFSLDKFLKSIDLSKKVYFVVFLTILLSKITLYQNFHSFRLFLGLGYVLLILSYYFKNTANANSTLKINILLLFSILFHTSLILYFIVFNIYLLLKHFKKNKLIFNCITIILLYLSYYLSYKEGISEILFYKIPGSAYLLSKISWFAVDYTGTNSHAIYYLVNPLVVGVIIFLINFLDYTKNKNDLEIFSLCSLLIIVLFINNTFVWKRLLYMFFPFYILIFFIYYNRMIIQLRKIEILSKINLVFVLILNILLLQMCSSFLNIETNALYFIHMIMTIIILKFAKYPVSVKNYNIFLFLPFLNISYLSLISLSKIDLYL
jgi:hypothetical protein